MGFVDLGRHPPGHKQAPTQRGAAPLYWSRIERPMRLPSPIDALFSSSHRFRPVRAAVLVVLLPLIGLLGGCQGSVPFMETPARPDTPPSRLALRLPPPPASLYGHWHPEAAVILGCAPRAPKPAVPPARLADLSVTITAAHFAERAGGYGRQCDTPSLRLTKLEGGAEGGHGAAIDPELWRYAVVQAPRALVRVTCPGDETAPSTMKEEGTPQAKTGTPSTSAAGSAKREALPWHRQMVLTDDGRLLVFTGRSSGESDTRVVLLLTRRTPPPDPADITMEYVRPDHCAPVRRITFRP